MRIRSGYGVRSSFGTGGPALMRCEVGSPDEALDAAGLAEMYGVPFLVLGMGTNILVSDAGIDGLVIRLGPPTDALAGLPSDFRDEEDLFITAPAAMVWDDFASWSVGQGWSGAECLSGIPGSVGAAPVQNIGAYGQHVGDVIDSVSVVDLQEKRLRLLRRRDCQFGYRSSIFTRPENLDRYLVTAVTFRFNRRQRPCRSYAEVAARTSSASAADEIRAIVLELRRGKGMLAGQYRSAGSFFKNPVVRALDAPPNAPAWPAGAGRVKLAAAWLVEQAGLRRGYSQGHVGLAPNHALAIVNFGGANSAEVIDFARLVQEKVSRHFGILLEPEVRLVGFPVYPLFKP